MLPQRPAKRRAALGSLPINTRKLQCDSTTIISPFPKATHCLAINAIGRPFPVLIKPQWLEERQTAPCLLLPETTPPDSIDKIRMLRLHSNPTPHLDTFCQTLRDAGLPDVQIGMVLGMERTVVSRWISLGSADPTLQAHVHSGQLTLGHARLLLHLPHSLQKSWALTAAKDKLTTSELRPMVQSATMGHTSGPDRLPSPEPIHAGIDAAIEKTRSSLSTRLSSPVELNWSRSSIDRSLTIKAWGIESLHGILEKILKNPPDREDAAPYTLTFSELTTDSLQNLVGHLVDE